MIEDILIALYENGGFDVEIEPKNGLLHVEVKSLATGNYLVTSYGETLEDAMSNIFIELLGRSMINVA